MIEALGHLAIWVGVYATSWMLMTSTLLGVERHGSAIAVVALSTISVYLLDRIKLTNAALDPADLAAHPRRRAFLERHAVAVRSMMLVVAASSMAIGWFIHPLVPVCVLLAHAGVWLYGSMPSRPRVKDRLFIKNAAVAVSMGGYVTTMVVLADASSLGDAIRTWTEPIHLVQFLGVLSFVILHVLLDAMLCDIDDAPADLQFGTETLVNRFGEPAVWRLAALGSIVGAGGFVLIAWFNDAPEIGTALRIGAALFGAKAALWAVRRWVVPSGRWIRDAVDLHVVAGLI